MTMADIMSNTSSEFDYVTPFSTPLYPKFLPMHLSVITVMEESMFKQVIEACFPTNIDPDMPYELKRLMFIKFNSKWMNETKGWRKYKTLKDRKQKVGIVYESNLCTNLIKTEWVRHIPHVDCDTSLIPKTLMMDNNNNRYVIHESFYMYWMKHYGRSVVPPPEPIHYFRDKLEKEWAVKFGPAPRRRKK